MLHTNFLFRSIFFGGGGRQKLLPTGVKILNPPLNIPTFGKYPLDILSEIRITFLGKI